MIYNTKSHKIKLIEQLAIIIIKIVSNRRNMMVMYLNKKYLFHFMEKKEKLNGDNKIYLNRIENENLFVELRSSEKIGQDIGYQFFFLTILINIFLFLN